MAAIAAVAAALGGVFLPASVSAHPLGNFTINHYNGLTIGVQRVHVDHVLDMAEIPALQARQTMDSDGDGTVSEADGARWAETTCRSGADSLLLDVDGAAVTLAPTAVGLTFPSGQAGLLTIRLVCIYEGAYPPLAEPTAVEFRDETFEDRLGWREIVVRGDGVTLNGAEDFAVGSSDRLLSYPPAMLEAPRAQPAAGFTATPGGPNAPAEPPTDAVPIGSDASAVMSGATAAAMPGAMVELPAELGAIIQAQDLTPAAIVLSLALAVLIGAVHAASPGHGKTLMAAYLVGSRGTLRHALGLGLTVTISHTVGVLALGALVVVAGAVVPAERLFPILGLVSGLVVTAMGVALLVQRVTDERRRRLQAQEHAHDHEHGQPHHHGNEGESTGDGWHSHGLVRHTHLPRTENPLRWRNLVALGLVGGLVPSASAILILVGSIAAGRPAYGMILTLAFGTGMAVVLVGVGALLVRARNLVERMPSATRLAPLFARLPLLTVVVFLVVGSTITLQAWAQLP